jgi:nickel-dependent lactate racemase
MPRQLQFGSASTVSYAPRNGLLHWAGPNGRAIADVQAVAAEALAAPIDFPPLRMAIVPGDKIVLALEPGVPRAAALVAAVVDALMQGGASAEDITVLQTHDDPQSATGDPRDKLPDGSRRQVRLATHHPGERKDLSYLGADEHDQPIYISRHLFDADVVVPIGCVRVDDALGYGGVRATLYPTFADQAAHERCRATGRNGAAPGSTAKQRSRRTRGHAPRQSSTGTAGGSGVSQHEANHVAWLLGVLFSVQVVPGSADNLLHVLAGHLEVVLERGRELCRQAWTIEVPRRANLVVATLTGSAQQQTWDNVGRAVAAAQRVVTENGIIALCTELSATPGPGIRTAGAAQDLPQAQRRLHKHNPVDIAAAEQWSQALSRARVYLLSRLEEEQVEDLGAAHVAAAEEVSRLIERSESCVLLESAQFALPMAVEE